MKDQTPADAGKRNAPGAATPEASNGVRISEDSNEARVTPPPRVSTERPSRLEDEVLELRVTPLSCFFFFREEVRAKDDCAWAGGAPLSALASRARCNGAESVLEAALAGFSAREVAAALASGLARLDIPGSTMRTPATGHLDIALHILTRCGGLDAAADDLASVPREHEESEDEVIELAISAFGELVGGAMHNPPGYLAAYFTMCLARLVDARALDYFALRVIEAAHEARILDRSGCSRMPLRRGSQA